MTIATNAREVMPDVNGVPKIAVSVIVPFFKRQPDIEALLVSFEQLDLEGVDLEFLVVEDGSAVANKDDLLRRHATIGLRFLTNAVNRGPGYSRNLAVGESRGTYLWFLDSDSEIVRSDTLAALIAALNETSDRLAVGGVVEMVEDQRKVMIPTILANFQFMLESTPWTDKYEQSVDFLRTCNLFVSKERFMRAGGFDASLKMFEDNELCLRLSANDGGEFYQNARTLVFHRIVPHGRDGGAFDYFCDYATYLRVLLHTRNILLQRYRRWLLSVLPLAEGWGAIVLARGVMIGRWNLSRVKKANNNGRSQLRVAMVTLLIIAEFQLKALMAFVFPESCQTAVREPLPSPREVSSGNDCLGGISM